MGLAYGLGGGYTPEIDPSMIQTQPPSFLTKLRGGLNAFSGNRDLALALLANSSGPTAQPFGSIVGQSMMQADQMKQARADDAFKQQYMQAVMARMQAQAKSAPQPAGTTPRVGVFQPGDYTPESFAIFQKSSNPADLVRYKAPGRIASATAPKAQGFDDPKIQQLQASFVAAGYSPPAGFRAKEQQLSMYQGLLKKYEGLSTDDIAHLAASNSIDYKSIGKATQAAAGMGGRVEVANNELRGFIPIAKDASAAVDRSAFVPYNRLKQKGQAAISDPNLKRLYVATQTVLNAYDVLAARGGTDKDKRAENHRILENADSPEAYNAALDMIVREGAAAGTATRDAMKANAFGYPDGQPPAPPTKELTYDPATGTFK